MRARVNDTALQFSVNPTVIPVHAAHVSKKCQKKWAAALPRVTGAARKRRKAGRRIPQKGEEPKAEERHKKERFFVLALPII